MKDWPEDAQALMRSRYAAFVVARSRIGGVRAHRLHERSRFVKEGGRWYYLDGDML